MAQTVEDARTECIVAAILTVSAVGTGADGATAAYVVRHYAGVLQQLRAMGGFDNPDAALLVP